MPLQVGTRTKGDCEEEMIFYDWSGGMESSAVIALEIDRIRETGACVRFADTGKQFPELYESKKQIEAILGIEIITVPRRIDFDTYLYERGGMIRKGTNDCSRRMKRGNLSRHMHSFPRPYEVNLGFNAGETDRAIDFSDRNERDWLHWRYPLIERGIYRQSTREICVKTGFSIVVAMYDKMGRMDCYFCGNQKESQALKVVEHYPELASEWMRMEERKGHSTMPIPLRVLVDYSARQGNLFSDTAIRCSCFGGNDNATGEGDED
jgi:hypothetical protein